ncbi:hypothetical protein HDU79_007480 [Rhizoclosmatium sp. JEL0117]|nr:hypothetical protein HDU79_007480 [Rhizoclosmatium sp. JEL0117]
MRDRLQELKNYQPAPESTEPPPQSIDVTPPTPFKNQNQTIKRYISKKAKRSSSSTLYEDDGPDKICPAMESHSQTHLPPDDPTDILCTRIDNLQTSLHSLQIQLTRLTHSIAEFETDPTHGMWNSPASPDSPTSFAKAIIAEKVDVFRDALRTVKREILALGVGVEGCGQMVQFQKCKMAKEVARLSDEFRAVVEGMVKRENGVLELSVKSKLGVGAGEWITSDKSFQTSSGIRVDEAKTTLERLVQSRDELDLELDREREWKKLEEGMTELVDLFGEMRCIVEIQDHQFTTICTSLESTETNMKTAVVEITKATEQRRRSRRTCWIWWGIFATVLSLGIVAVVIYFKVSQGEIKM